jgi:hypothetical protein
VIVVPVVAGVTGVPITSKVNVVDVTDVTLCSPEYSGWLQPSIKTIWLTRNPCPPEIVTVATCPVRVIEATVLVLNPLTRHASRMGISCPKAFPVS